MCIRILWSKCLFKTAIPIFLPVQINLLCYFISLPTRFNILLSQTGKITLQSCPRRWVVWKRLGYYPKNVKIEDSSWKFLPVQKGGFQKTACPKDGLDGSWLSPWMYLKGILHSRFALLAANKCSLVKMPAPIENLVRKQNIKFMHNKNQFSMEYFQFMRRLLTCNALYVALQPGQEKLVGCTCFYDVHFLFLIFLFLFPITLFSISSLPIFVSISISFSLSSFCLFSISLFCICFFSLIPFSVSSFFIS